MAPLWPALAAVLGAGALLWYLLPGLFRKAAGGPPFDAAAAALALIVAGAGAGILIFSWWVDRRPFLPWSA